MKNIKGITLIALVITIIILLILAGVTIQTITGDNGLFARAKQAKRETEIATIKEQIQSDVLAKQAENNGEISDNELKEILKRYGLLSGEENILENILTTNKGKYEIKVSDIWNGVITKKEEITTLPEIEISTPTVNTSNSTSVTETLRSETVDIGTTLYINFNVLTEGITYKVKYENSEITMPYPVSKGGIYKFTVEGEYKGVALEPKEVEVAVRQFKKEEVGFVNYEAGNWKKEEIDMLQSQKLYYNNSDGKFSDNSFLKFGGFTYSGSSLSSRESLSTSKDKSTRAVSMNENCDSKYNGWRILEKEEVNGRIYVKKLVHAGCPETFSTACRYSSGEDNGAMDGFRALKILGWETTYSSVQTYTYDTYPDGSTITPRTWQMYIDDKYKDMIKDINDPDGNLKKDIHPMNNLDAYNITGSSDDGAGTIRQVYTGYVLAVHGTVYSPKFVTYDGSMNGYMTFGEKSCSGVRPVITMKDGVYVKSGKGTQSDPYVLAME